MTKSILNFYPMLINLMIITLIMIPSNYKFHPMMMMLILIMITLLIALKMNFMYYSWNSYFLFLIMIGGLMIIYMYISSLTNNELFFINYKTIKLNLMKIIFLTLFSMILFYFNLPYLNSMDLWNLIYNNMYDMININIIYMKITNFSTYFIMLYLYYTMICVMNICYKNKMPLRQLTL